MFSRKCGLACGFFLAALSVTAPSAHGSVATDIKKQVQALYNQANAAAERKDVAGAVAFYGDPALQSSARAAIARLIATSTSPVFASKIISVDVPKDNTFEATVVVLDHFQGLIKHDGRMGVGISDSKVRQFWTKIGQRWLVQRSRVLSIHRTFNDAPVSSF